MAPSQTVASPAKKKKKTEKTSKKLKVRKDKSSKSGREKSSKSGKASSSREITTVSSKGKDKVVEENDEFGGGLSLLKRNPVTMKEITSQRILRRRQRVEFDKYDNPVGRAATKMQSYIGVLARTKIRIIYEDWPAVPAVDKDTLWKTVCTAFILEPDRQKMVLSSAGIKWKDFKSRLTTNYILPYLEDPEALRSPPKDYKFINKDDWTLFVEGRKTQAFLDKHDIQSDRRSQNPYEHNISRKGYSGLRQELLESMDEEDIDRGVLWVKGHMSKDGTFKDPAIKETAEKIDELREKQRRGELQIKGADDILTLALGTPEHSGRVRGIGGYVLPTVFFDVPVIRSRTSIARTVTETMQKVWSETNEKMKEDIAAQIREEERLKFEEKERWWKARFDELENKLSAVVGSGAPALGSGVCLASGEASCSKNLAAPAHILPTQSAHVDTVAATIAGVNTIGTASHDDNEVQSPKRIKKKHKFSVTTAAVRDAIDALDTKYVSKGHTSKKPPYRKSTPKENEEPEGEDQLEKEKSSPQSDHIEELVEVSASKSVSKVTTLEVDCLLALESVDNIVAQGTVMTGDSVQLVHGRVLGEENMRVSVSKCLDEKALKAVIPFPVEDEIRTLKQAMGSWVAWPKKLIVFKDTEEIAIEKARKKLHKYSEKYAAAAEYDFGAMADSAVPPYMKELCIWGQKGFTDEKQICFEMEDFLFGTPRGSCMLDKDVKELANLEKIGSNIIVAYMRCLYDKLKESKMEDMIGFVDPAHVGSLCGSVSKRANLLKNRLILAKENQIFLMPYNEDGHWMLMAINPEKELVYFMDPAKRRLLVGEGRNMVDNAILQFKEHRNLNFKHTTWKNLPGIPRQPYDKECGYYVMCLMRDIVNDRNMAFADRWAKRNKNTFGIADIDEVRDAVAKYLLEHHVKQ